MPPDSSGSRTSFKRAIKELESFFFSLTGDRGFGQHYVVEWHSHPRGRARPSPADGVDSVCHAQRLDYGLGNLRAEIVAGDLLNYSFEEAVVDVVVLGLLVRSLELICLACNLLDDLFCGYVF